LENGDNLKDLLTRPDESYLIISNSVNSINHNHIKPPVTYNDIGVDTNGLYEDHTFDYESLKKNYINTMISWSFLKKLSEFHQWPLACIGNFVENSLHQDVQAKNFYIDVVAYDKFIYTVDNSQPIKLTNSTNLSNKLLVLSLKDDGAGIAIKEFNQILFSFSINEKKEYNFFKYGISLKASAVRLANSLLLISKTQTELSIGMISKGIQVKMATDFILTPVINYIIEEGEGVGGRRYIPRSNFAQQSLNLILNEIKFMFKDVSEFFSYINSFETGTHIFLYDLKQISSIKNDINNRTNYELLVDFENRDIIYNCFEIQISDPNYIDGSLKTYLKYLYLKMATVTIHLMGLEVDTSNPFETIYGISKNESNVVKANTNLKLEDTKTDCVYIEGEIYKGVFFNKKFYQGIIKEHGVGYSPSEIFNGILIYRNNRLISRFEQNKLGDISFFIKEFIKHDNLDKLFKISGFVEVPSSYFDLLYSKTVSLV
jgi:hypothetical protein